MSYESLFEILRLEKSRDELQKLDPEFFDEVLEYIKDKVTELESGDNSIFLDAQREQTRKELENLKRILKELYDRREKKLLEMALIKSRTDMTVVNKEVLLDVERELLETITNDLQLYRKSILHKILGGAPVKSSSQMSRPKTPEKVPEPRPEEKDLKRDQISDETGQRVRFLQAMDEIVGPDLQIYGPFEKEAVASLPGALAKVLINNGQAQVIQ